MKPLITCTPMALPGDRLLDAADVARRENPVNHPPVGHLIALAPASPELIKVQIAVMTTKYWRGGKTRFTVGFLDNPPNDLRAKIIAHMNAWSAGTSVSFVESNDAPMVRISRAAGGYWSYLGTDILLADRDKQTMNLEGFTMSTPDSEFYRVVRHETGHTLGCPHEHMRAELVELVDPDKAIAYFGQTQGWTPDQVRAQVLTPLEQRSLWGTDRPDAQSIMCYQIPGALTRNGKPILGGTDIDPSDYAFISKVYPGPIAQPAHAAAGAAPDNSAAAAPPCAECIQIEQPGGLRISMPADIAGTQLDAVLGRILASATPTATSG